MEVLQRDDKGLFALKSDSKRKVRSIRATDKTWDDFCFLADQRRITPADLLEKWASHPPGQSAAAATDTPELQFAIGHLKQALTLKANAGGAIKEQIRKALELLE